MLASIMQESISDLLHKAQTMLNLGNPKDAMNIYDKILSMEPQQTDALIKKGNILGKLGKYEEAILHYDKAISKDNQNILAIINKGLAHHYLEQYDIAINCYNKILTIKPNSTLTIYNKASSMIKSNRVKEGLELLSKAIKLDYSYKAKAECDIDFQHIRKMNEFKKIILQN